MTAVKRSLQNVRAVLFDVGGTLLEFDAPESLGRLRKGFVLAHKHLTAAGARLPSELQYRRRMERWLLCRWLQARLHGRELMTMRELVEAHAKMGIALEDGALTAVALKIYEPMRAIGHADPGTAAALRQLAGRGLKLGIVSNTIAPPAAIDAHLQAEDLLEPFSVRVYSCDIGVAKPHPRIFREALRRLEVEPSTTIYVGDRPRIDVRGARRVGMATVLMSRTGRWSIWGPRPDYCVRTIAELPDLLGVGEA